MLDLAGKKFGRLLVLQFSHRDRRNYWVCKCDCGKTKTVNQNSMMAGNTKSCGCLHREFMVKLGKSKTTHGRTMKDPTYQSWIDMKRRCLDPNRRSYKDYGGRGITVCQRWFKFENFLADMGDKPHGLTLDRKENHGHYEPENCRWATPKVQAGNRRVGLDAAIRSDNSTGFKGVRRRPGRKGYSAAIVVRGQRIHLGTRDAPEEAAALYVEAAKCLLQ